MSNFFLIRSNEQRQRAALVLIIGLLGALIGTYILVSHRQVRDTEIQDLATQARVVSTNLSLQIKTTDRVLDEILVLLDFDEPMVQEDRMQSLVNAMPMIRAIAVLDSDGVQVMGTRRVNNGMDFSNRSYFRDVLVRPQRYRIYVSPPFTTLTGQVSIAMSKIILNGKGGSEGVLVAILEPDYLDQLMKSTLQSPDMWAALLHRGGTNTIRVDGQGLSSGRLAVPDEDLRARFDELTREGRPGFVHENGGDREQLLAASRVAGYSFTDDQPLWVITGRDYHTAMEDWRRLAYMQGGLFVLFVVMTVAGLLFYQRRQRQFESRRMADRRRVRAREQDYRAIVEHTSDCVVRLDVHGHYSYVNPAFCATFGLQPQTATGREFLDQLSGDCVDEARQTMRVALREASEQRFHGRFETLAGPRHMEWTLCSVAGDDGAISNLIGVGRDVSVHVAAHDALRTRAQRDSLTGLVNRGHFVETATTEIHRSQRYGTPLSIMMIDLDHFKKANDTWGHQGGDVALQTCARVLDGERREFDIPGRLGGEEFAMLLPDTPLEDALQAAERLRTAIATQAVRLADGVQFHLTASVGVAALQRDESLDQMMHRADLALYAAKQKGRNRVEAASAMPSSASRPAPPAQNL